MLAKELGIDSKEIIAKCEAEGIPLANHMAVVKLGLAESIREWFSAGQDVTSVETASPVDLAKVKKRPTRRKSKDELDQEQGDSHALDESVESADGLAEENEAMPVEEAPVETVEEEAVPEPLAPAAEAEVETIAPPIPDEAPSAAPEVLEPAAEVPPVEPVAPPVAPPTPKVDPTPITKPIHDDRPVVLRPSEPPPFKPLPTPVRPAQPNKPSVPLRPAGPQVVPTPAALQGPRVVRIEAPDPVRAPRPRTGPPSGAPFGRPGGPPPAPGAGDRPGWGPGTARPPAAKSKEEEERETVKVRARSPRRQGGEDVVERLKEWRDQDLLERKERLAHVTGQGLRTRRTAEKRRQAGAGHSAGPVERKAELSIVAPIMLKEFCATVGVPYKTISQKLMEHTGAIPRINDSIDAETIELLAMELGLAVSVTKALSPLEKLEQEFENRERNNLQSRPPVCAMLGHVDHGKTSLLDAIRQTKVAAGEAGGITQHIGAYRIDRGQWHVTFLDTPGHEAFTAMRARGANMTDVVVLVVAADDGMMPQTIEALNHARAANVQVVVALNKIDLPGVDTNKLYGQLAEHGLTPTEWGGQTDVVKTSATKGLGVDELIEHLSTLSDLLDLKADPTIPAAGIVIEARLREGRGPVAQILVREGTLKPGQFIVCGPASGRVRSLYDDRGNRVDSAGPATPVEVIGLDAVPNAGDKLFVVESLARAKEIAGEVTRERREATLHARRKPTRTLEDLLSGTNGDEIPVLSLILKADVQGSLESLKVELEKIPAEKVRVRLLHAAIGAISEADVALARASEAIIIGFNVVADDRAQDAAEQAGVQIRTYRIIYEVISDIQKAMRGLLDPIRTIEVRAKVEVRQIFHLSKFGTVAGCVVVDGVVNRSHRVRLVRDGRIVVENAALESLKRVKDDAREVRAGLECGIKIAGFDDIKPGDVLETFEVVESEQQL